MKKIIICILILVSCGCQKNEIKENPENTLIAKRDILKEKAKKIYKNDINDEVALNITFLYTIIDELPNNKWFESCDKETTRIEHIVYEIDSKISSQYKIILDCDNVVTTYFYNNLEDNEPLNVTTKNK